MVCAKCGALVDDNLNVCDNCGYVFEDNVAQAETDGSEYNINTNTPALPDAFKPVKEKREYKLNRLLLVLAVIAAATVVILTFFGAHYITEAGISLSSLQSSSASSIFGFGGGIDSNYYRFVGVALYGASYAIKGIGVAFAAIIVLLGIRNSN